jgi:hypothetical protein
LTNVGITAPITKNASTDRSLRLVPLCATTTRTPRPHARVPEHAEEEAKNPTTPFGISSRRAIGSRLRAALHHADHHAA